MAAPTPTTGPRFFPQNDLYTVLLIAATALLLTGIVFLMVRSSQLFESIIPVAPAAG